MSVRRARLHRDDAPADTIAHSRTAELLAIGAELLVGETRDTNSGDIAGYLTELGVEVRRMTQLPDELGVHRRGRVAGALERVDLVVTTGGLGPTPDDLTREGIAAALGEEPDGRPGPRGLAARPVGEARPALLRRQSQAGLAASRRHGPGQSPRHGTRLVGRTRATRSSSRCRDHRASCGRCGTTMRSLACRRVASGLDRAAHTLRLTGIGESTVVDLIGKELLERRQPPDGDVRAGRLRSTCGSAPQGDGQHSAEAAGATRPSTALSPRIDPYVFAHDEEGWAEALGRAPGRTQPGHRSRAAPVAISGSCSGRHPSCVRAELTTARSTPTRPRARHGASELGRQLTVGVAAVAHESGDDMRVDVAVDIGTTALVSASQLASSAEVTSVGVGVPPTLRSRSCGEAAWGRTPELRRLRAPASR